MVDVEVRHTSSLHDADLQAVRVLLDDAFDDGITDDDLEHALGGMHALVWQENELVAHGSVIMRRLLHEGRALRTGYVEAVGVRRDRRRQGHGNLVMAALEQIIGGAYELGALGASEMAGGLYAARGWLLWTGTASVITPTGIERTPDDADTIYVFPVTATLTWTSDLACDWRNGDVW